jgi:YidC/Oxa1 family membrane protein insertase
MIFRKGRLWQFCLLVSAFLTIVAGGVRAQVDSGLPSSPAFVVAQRIQHEAEAAWKTAYQLHVAGRFADAGAEHHLAQLRAHQAISEYSEVVSSHLYGRTAVGAEALVATAHLYRDILTNPDAAAQSYKQIHDNFSLINFPDKQVAEQERLALAQFVDTRNRTTFPTMILYHIMDGLVKLTGSTSQSYWIAIVMISVLVKLAMWPVSNKQYKSMKEMQKLQPYIAEIKGKYKDPQIQGEKIKELYAEHDVNMLGGCFPLLLQMPVWYLLFNMIRAYQFQFQHGTFLWIGSPLAHMYPAIFAPDLNEPDIPLLGLYMLSMYISQKLVVPSDPQAAEQARTMAIMAPFMSGYFFLQYKWPSAFLLYYLVFNILSMVQQQMYQRGNKKDAVDAAVPATRTESSTNKPYYGTSEPNGRAKGLSDSGAAANGAQPTAKGAIAPKVHPRKKRR